MQVGDIVETSVFVGKDRRITGSGRIVAVHSGYYTVDIGYPHTAPWLVAYTEAELRKIDSSDGK